MTGPVYKYKIKVHLNTNNKPYFTIVSVNGQCIAVSEDYTDKSSMMRTIKALQDNLGLPYEFNYSASTKKPRKKKT